MFTTIQFTSSKFYYVSQVDWMSGEKLNLHEPSKWSAHPKLGISSALSACGAKAIQLLPICIQTIVPSFSSLSSIRLNVELYEREDIEWYKPKSLYMYVLVFLICDSSIHIRVSFSLLPSLFMISPSFMVCCYSDQITSLFVYLSDALISAVYIPPLIEMF